MNNSIVLTILFHKDLEFLWNLHLDVYIQFDKQYICYFTQHQILINVSEFQNLAGIGIVIY